MPPHEFFQTWSDLRWHPEVRLATLPLIHLERVGSAAGLPQREIMREQERGRSRRGRISAWASSPSAEGGSGMRSLRNGLAEEFLHQPCIGTPAEDDERGPRRLAPDSLSVIEFKNPMDVRIAEKMLAFPLFGERINNV